MLMEQEKRDKILNVIKDYYDEIEHDIVTRLRCGYEDYSKLFLENMNLINEHPIIEDVLYYGERFTLNKKDHKALIKYLSNMFWMEHEERLELYYRGHADCIAYFKRIGLINYDFDDIESSPEAEKIRLNVLREVFDAYELY